MNAALLAFIRISTSPVILPAPLAAEDAIGHRFRPGWALRPPSWRS
jgi:hypothetical protein